MPSGTQYLSTGAAIALHKPKSVAGGADVTLVTTPGASNEDSYFSYNFTGALTANISVIFPQRGKFYLVKNSTTGAFTLTMKMPSGATVAVPQGERKLLYNDGTDVVDVLAAVAGGVTSVFGRTGAVVATAGDYTATQITNTPAGNIAATTVQAALNELDTEKAPLASPAFTGTPTAPTAAAGTNTTQIATTSFVASAIAAGHDFKAAVRVATTAALTLASDFENGDTVDGVTLATGDRILIKDQSSGAENGIYIVAASGAPARAADADTSAEVTSGLVVAVEEGTANADRLFMLTTNNPITLDTTALTFAPYGVSGSPTGSAGGDLTGTYPNPTVASDAITNAKLANMVGATIKGRSAGAGIGDPEDLTSAQAAEIVKSNLTVAIVASLGDETTAVTAGTSKIVFRMPFAFTLQAVRASLTTAQSSGSILTVDINESGATLLSTKLTIDNTEKTSTTAATAAAISDTALADDAEISIDVDQVGTGPAGLKVTLIGVRA